jgi:lipopolysaccharide heptosyltransferase I
MSEPLEKILIIKPSSLGDIVLALPALAALRKSFPRAKISWLVRPEFAPLLRGHPQLDEIIHFDRRYLGRAWRDPAAMKELLSLAARLRKCGFDAVLDLQGLFRTACLGWLSGCRRRFGMADAREMAHVFYTHRICRDSDNVHVVDYYLKIARAAGAGCGDVEFVLPDTSGDAGDIIERSGLSPGRYVVLVPTSAHRSKCWPAGKFAALAERIVSESALSVAAVGTAAEKPLVERLCDIAKVAVTNLAGLTNLEELVAVLRSSAAVVSNDTGPGHIAAALGGPVVLIFGRSNPARVAPYGRMDCVAAVEPDSRGTRHTSRAARHDVKAVTVEEVYEKLRRQL